jgi:hypothetical protein
VGRRGCDGFAGADEATVGSPFEAYCRRHGVSFPGESGVKASTGAEPTPRLLLPEAPVKPKGSKLKKWSCPCGVNVRVAVANFDATCNRCGKRFDRAT